ncbi:putative oxidoreductase [Microdochium trichocladiopsis]|uniref:Oxidoreductase n=1 Tax=Microdochium trichocladiopsis TaxID=1682393 RepID=A0A9P8Y573_9PEZI|nr:putative oxidoreductase [Microdochium trichocladiopsis]KAH7029584.1 putative oxidoreductase [Microdochium trichocladiopsis]
MAQSKPPQLIFGTAAFGSEASPIQDGGAAAEVLRALKAHGVHRLDSGARYPPLQPGRAEQIIGETGDVGLKFDVDTKVYTDTRNDGSGDLTLEKINESCSASLKRLQTGKINVLHVHRADPATPLEEQIQGFKAQIDQGRCRAWGISNMSPEVLEKVLHLCEENNWPKPVCYQGQYNLITRGVETRLLPLLRAHGIAFNGYGPLAAGFLTGNLLANNTAGTRFDSSTKIGPIITKIYSQEDLFKAMARFQEALKKHDMTPNEVAIRWVAHHSMLSNEHGDGIIMGASRTEQAVQTMEYLEKGPIAEQDVLQLIEELWEGVKVVRGDML